jgi:hypothetical protein
MVEKIGTYEDKSIKCHHKKYLVDKFIFKFRCLSIYQAIFRHDLQDWIRKKIRNDIVNPVPYLSTKKGMFNFTVLCPLT